MAQSPSPLAGAALCLVATASWGGMFPVMAHALHRMDPFTLSTIRYVLAAIVFALFLLWKEGRTAFHLRGERWLLAWLLGSGGFAGFGFLVFLGQQLAGENGALTASIMMATMPMLGLLVAWIITRHRPALASLMLVVFSFCGVILVMTRGEGLSRLLNGHVALASLLLLSGALCWVCYTVGASFFPAWSAWRYTALTSLLGLTSLLAIEGLLLLSGLIPPPQGAALLSLAPHILYMGLGAGFLGVISWNFGNRILGPVNGILFMNVVPLTTFLLSALTGTVPRPVQLAGAALTAASLFLNNLLLRRRLRRQSLAS